MAGDFKRKIDDARVATDSAIADTEDDVLVSEEESAILPALALERAETDYALVLLARRLRALERVVEVARRRRDEERIGADARCDIGPEECTGCAIDAALDALESEVAGG